MPLRKLLVRLYRWRLRRQVAGGPLPRHLGLIIDGNRRWAKQAGLASPSDGHRHGAEHIWDALSWCQTVGIRHVTVFISGLILANFGNGPVKGFAYTLIVGIICSLFTGVFCTRVVFDWWVRGAKVKRLSVGAEF